MTDESLVTQVSRSMKALELSLGSFNLPDLPRDIFALVIENLEPWEIVRCQLVSSAWQEAFSVPEYLRLAMKRYPNAREARELLSHDAPDFSDLETASRWRAGFNKIACRYYHLAHGRPREIRRHATSAQGRGWYSVPVPPFEYHESQPGGRLHHDYDAWEHTEVRPGWPRQLFGHSFWTYEEGLLIFIPAEPGEDEFESQEAQDSSIYPLVLLDIERRTETRVPFDPFAKVVRNFRLKDRTLIIEWAEEHPYHGLNDIEKVHRHFVTCYDVKTCSTLENRSASSSWEVVFRNEFKVHFLGFPFSNRDRFFSTHTHSHYAHYLWQPNRSLYTGDEDQPIECIIIWDMMHPCDYMPSRDTGGLMRMESMRHEPHVVFRIGFQEMEFYAIRQRSSVRIIKMILDSEQGTISLRENVCTTGHGYFDPAERLFCATTTTVSFKGQGPHMRREWDGKLPVYRGNCSMETCDILETESWFLAIMDVVDADAQVRYSLTESVLTGADVENTRLIRIYMPGNVANLDESITKRVGYQGKIAGDERFLIGENEELDLVILSFD